MIGLASLLLISATFFGYLKAFYKTELKWFPDTIDLVAERPSSGLKDFKPIPIDKSQVTWNGPNPPGQPPIDHTYVNLIAIKFLRVIMAQEWKTKEVNGKLVSSDYKWNEKIIVLIPHWTILATFGGIVAIVVLHIIHIRKRQNNDNECQSCGYNLTGNLSGTCPECGKAIA
jgi:hypothetical protein